METDHVHENAEAQQYTCFAIIAADEQKRESKPPQTKRMQARVPFKTSSRRSKTWRKYERLFHLDLITNTKMSGFPGIRISLYFVEINLEEAVLRQESSETDRVQILHNCLSGVRGKQFYSTVRRTEGNSEITLNMISDRFSSKQHQWQDLAYLFRLSFWGIMNETSCSDMEAHATGNLRILKYISQCGLSYQNEHQEGLMSGVLQESSTDSLGLSTSWPLE